MQNPKRKFTTRCNAPVVKNKPCKRCCVLTGEGRHQTGSKWQKISWNVMVKKNAAPKQQGKAMQTIKKNHNL